MTIHDPCEQKHLDVVRRPTATPVLFILSTERINQRGKVHFRLFLPLFSIAVYSGYITAIWNNVHEEIQISITLEKRRLTSLEQNQRLQPMPPPPRSSGRIDDNFQSPRSKNTLRPWIDPPQPLHHYLWNASSIQWVGNSFYFPPNEDYTHDDDVYQESSHPHQFLYTPHQIQKAFRHHSVLFQGDSTIRRLFGTLDGILGYDVESGSRSGRVFGKGFPSSVPMAPYGTPETYFIRRGLSMRSIEANNGKQNNSTTNEHNHAKINPASLALHSPSPIDPRYLDHQRVIDVNKDYNTEPCHRKFPPNYLINVPNFGASQVGNESNIDADIIKEDDMAKSSFTKKPFEYKICRPHPTGGWVPPLPLPPHMLPQSVRTQQTQTNEAVSSNLKRQRRTLFPLHYDYVNTNCLGHIHDFVTLELEANFDRSVLKKYSIYLVGPGVWETVKPHACNHPMLHDISDNSTTGQRLWSQLKIRWPETLYELQKIVLEKLAALAEKMPDILIIWRTSGYYDRDPNSFIIRELNRQSLSFINDWNKMAKRSNFLCLDFGSAIETRSQGNNRLRGDMQAHYGLEARIMQAQMITNLMFAYGFVADD